MIDDCYCDYDPPAFSSQYIVKAARRAHVCEECRRAIPKGASYEYTSGLWDGHFDTFKTCLLCCDLRKWTWSNIPCFCWAHGNMLDDARNAIDEAISRAPGETKGVRFGFLRLLYRIRRAPRMAA